MRSLLTLRSLSKRTVTKPQTERERERINDRLIIIISFQEEIFHSLFTLGFTFTLRREGGGREEGEKE